MDRKDMHTQNCMGHCSTASSIRLFEEDAYLAECSAVVVRITKSPESDELYEIVLDRTVFFPEGGGQSADTGWILPEDGEKFDALRVLDVQTRAEEIIHYVEGAASLPSAGDKVTAMIDWDRRFGFMQNHGSCVENPAYSPAVHCTGVRAESRLESWTRFRRLDSGSNVNRRS